MKESCIKIAKILRMDAQKLHDFEIKMNEITEKKDVIDRLAVENELLMNRTLQELGVSEKTKSAEDVYRALIKRLEHIDQHLYESLGRPNLSVMSNICGKLCDVAMSVNGVPRGYFIKRERAVRMLEKYPPTNLIEHFKVSTVAELVENQGFSSVFSALRFTQDEQWMHKYFDEAYDNLTADDFEEREVELKVLETKWLDVAEKFLKKKHHNVSHLKELGIIFIVPLTIDIPGETLRMFTLLLHYLNEVPFYSKLIRRFSLDTDFTVKLKSLLRGDVPEGPVPQEGKYTFRIVQRYLAKDDPNDFRLLEPHINPEAEHWYKAERDLGKVATLLAEDGHTLGFWQGLDFVGGYFKNLRGSEELVSFDLIDLVMTLVEQKEAVYHQQEAIWNKIFVEYLGREELQKLIENNIINGFIHLK